MKKLTAATVFILAAVILLWKPILLGKAILPGDYLQQMQPWSANDTGQRSSMQWNPLSWDAISQFYPWRVFLGRSLRQGILPIWNPHQFCGTPFLANGQSAVFYPPNWIFAFCDPIRAFTYLAVFHLALAGFLAFMLIKGFMLSDEASVFGGLSFELCAFMIYWLELPTLISAAAWMPGVLWAIHQSISRKSYKYGVLAAVLLAMPMLAGHLQVAFYVWIIASGWIAFLLVSAWKQQKKYPKTEIGILSVAVILGLMISFAQILPSVELQSMSHRHIPASMDGYKRFSESGLPAYRFVTALMPDYFGVPNRSNYFLLGQIGNRFNMPADFMEFGLYAGIAILPLAFIGVLSWRKSSYIKFWIVASILSLLLASGTLLNWPLYFVVPGFSSLGGPHRILVIYMLGIAVLAAFGMDRLSEKSAKKFEIFGLKLTGETILAAAGIIFMCVVGGITMAHADRTAAQLPKELSSALQPVQAGAVLRYAVLALISAVLLLLGSSKILKFRWFGYALIVLAAVDLIGYSWQSIPMCERSAVYPKSNLTDYLTQHKYRRVLPSNKSWNLVNLPKSILPPNSAMVYGFYDVQGYDSLYTSVYKDYLKGLFETDPCPPENGNMILGRNQTGNSLGVNLANKADVSEKSILADFDGIIVSDNGTNNSGWIAAVGDDPVSVEFATPNSVNIEIPHSVRDYVQVRVLNYPGWIDRDTGKSLENNDIWMQTRANGRSRIDLVFQPDSIKVGLFISLLGLAGCFSLLTAICINRK